MKLYHFNCNGYGEEFYTMAENKIKAYNALIAYFEQRIEDPKEAYKWAHEGYLKQWKNVNPEDPKTFPREFTLDEFEAGHIIQSEIA